MPPQAGLVRLWRIRALPELKGVAFIELSFFWSEDDIKVNEFQRYSSGRSTNPARIRFRKDKALKAS
jgi:hypothetical protein